MDGDELLDALLPPEANLPDTASDMARMHTLFDAVGAERLEQRALRLFGQSTAGIAQRLRSGRAVCVELARQILFDRASRLDRSVPPEWLTRLDALDARLTELAVSAFPELALPERRNPVLAFTLESDGTPMSRVLGARCHLMLTCKAQKLIAGGTVDLYESLRAQISPLKVARGFPWEKLPPLAQIEQNRQLARDVRHDLYQFISHLPNRRFPGRMLTSNTIKDYWGVLVATLDLPGDEASGAWRRLFRADNAMVFRLLDDDPPEDEDDPFSAALYQAEAQREAEDLHDESEEDETDIVEMSAAQRYARRDYVAQTAVLRQFVTIYDTQTVPMRQIALGYAALLGTYTPETAPVHVLAPLALYHLCLTTGRNVDELLAIGGGRRPESPCERPVFDLGERALFATPKLYPQLPKALRMAPDPEKDPAGFADWQRELAQHQRLYETVTPVREVVLDDFGRWCLCRLAEQRHLKPGSEHQGASLFVTPKGERMSREQAREAVTRKITALARRIMPDAPPITFSRLRHTFWSHMVAEQGVHPMLAQIESARTRSELYSHSFYSSVSRASLCEVIQRAQAGFMSQVIKAHADALPSWCKALGQAIKPLVLPASAPEYAAAARYGSTYCVRAEILRGVIGTCVQDIASIDTRSGDSSQAWDDAQVYFCALLTGICLGARVGEVATLSAAAVDLDFISPLATLIGKGNRFAEESRTLMIPARLVPLWRAALGDRRDGPAFQLHSQRAEGKRPLKRHDLWRYVAAMSAQAGFRGGLSDGVIRFHALRHHLVGAFLAQNVRFAHDAYWTGHQTSGAELLHPSMPGSLSAMWVEIEPVLHEMLTEMGVSDACIDAICRRDCASLCALLSKAKTGEDDGDNGIDLRSVDKFIAELSI